MEEQQYTDCKQLRAQQGSRGMQPRSAAILKSVKQANPGVVDDVLACSTNPTNPACSKVRRNTTDRVTTTNRILSQAQQQNFRSFESAINRSVSNRARYDQAVCSKLHLQAGLL